jgi:hypothetical protein
MYNRTGLKTKGRLWRKPSKVIERFTRALILRKSKAIGRAIARFVSRRKLLWGERQKIKALTRTLESCAYAAVQARRNKFHASETIFNLALFFLIAERDIQAAKVDALTHQNQWHRSLAARIILLTIHELDIDKAGGNRLRQAFEDAKVPEYLQKEAFAAMRTIRHAQQKAQKQFAQMRHSIIAHRDADSILQYRSITQLDDLSVVRTAAIFYEGTRAFMEVMPRLMKHIGGFNGLVSQAIAQQARSKGSLAS